MFSPSKYAYFLYSKDSDLYLFFNIQCAKKKIMSTAFSRYCCILVTKSCPTLHDPMDWSLPGSCPWDFSGKSNGVGCHFLLQGSSRPRDRTHVSCWPGELIEPPGKALVDFIQEQTKTKTKTKPLDEKSNLLPRNRNFPLMMSSHYVHSHYNWKDVKDMRTIFRSVILYSISEKTLEKIV